MSSTTRDPIKPNPPRWAPSSDPASIVIPGLDTEASTADQIEQIEQLITIKLQNIDENFSKIHNVLANKLLPAVKRYAVGTEPVREAAQFWTSFYEAAAQIRIPTFDDYSTVNEVPSEREEEEEEASREDDQHRARAGAGEGDNNEYDEEHTMTLPPGSRQGQAIYETSAVTSETSFLPGQGAFSSTPAMSRLATSTGTGAMTTADLSYASQGSEDDPSWTRSMESPLVRLNRELKDFSDEVMNDSRGGGTAGAGASGSGSNFASASAAVQRAAVKNDYNDSEYDDSSNFTFQQPSHAASASAPTPQPPRSEKDSAKDKSKGKAKETPQPLLKNLLRHNLYSASDNSSFELKTARLSLSPAKSKYRAAAQQKAKTPVVDKRLNPYLRAESAAKDGNTTTTTNTSDWSGIVDLRERAVLTPQRNKSSRKAAGTTTATTSSTTPYGKNGDHNADDDDDDSFDGLPPGMSPPVLMSPARPPRSSAELGLLRLGQTPARDASERIRRDILRDVIHSGGGGVGGVGGGGGGGGGNNNNNRRLSTFPKYEESSSISTVSGTPPSAALSRFGLNRGMPSSYNISSASSSGTKDSSLESMIRGIRSGIQPNVGVTPGMGMGGTPGLRIRPRIPGQGQGQRPVRSYQETPPPAVAGGGGGQHQNYFDSPSSEPATPIYGHQHQHQHHPEEIIDDGDLSSDSDSIDDEINNTAHPSAAFLMASQRRPRGDGDGDEDDSFGSSNHSSDSLNDEDEVRGAEGGVPVHPFAGVGAGGVVVDDGFEDEDDEDSFDGFDNGVGDTDGGVGFQFQDGEGEEETVFGVGPGVRAYADARAGRWGGQGQGQGHGLRMLGEDLLQDTIGIGSQIAATGRVEESPTPASWAHT